MRIFKIEPIRRRIDKYEKALQEKSLTRKQQKEILQELKARPYRFTYDESREMPVDFRNGFKEMKSKSKKTLTLELDNRTIMTFIIDETIFS